MTLAVAEALNPNKKNRGGVAESGREVGGGGGVAWIREGGGWGGVHNPQELWSLCDLDPIYKFWEARAVTVELHAALTMTELFNNGCNKGLERKNEWSKQRGRSAHCSLSGDVINIRRIESFEIIMKKIPLFLHVWIRTI